MQNLSKFFVDRPIFAGVLSVLILLAGLIAMWRLPISEYPDVVPPSIVVTANFPGANPAEISETVASPLEEQINGVEGMLYVNSLATTDGKLSLTVTFEIGTDPDLAQQKVQNRVSQAEPRLPDVVRQLGVTVSKQSPDLTMVVHLRSPNDRYDVLYMRNYATLHVRDRLARIRGVGQVGLFGSGDYAMRVWLNPDKVAERNLTAGEVVSAIQSQNVQVAAGIIGGAPYDSGVQFQLPINISGRLETPDEFKNIIVKRGDDGTITRLGDVARVEMQAQQYALRSLLDNKEAVAIPIFASPGANALDISSNVRAAMEELKQNFPEDLDYSIVYDPTVFVRSSIKSVITTLLEAIALVVVVVTIFLQTWRASIIPLLAVPVSIVGTFALMLVFGFSINVLSLFGLILAIGIVVDDAIVVVENVERNIERGLSPRDATVAAMREVTGPIIATSLVITGVFVPIAFISGLTGQFYQQFALTIAIATIISTVNSLTLSPALSAILLRGQDAPKDWLTRGMDFVFGWFFRGFNRFFNRSTDKYAGGVKRLLGLKSIMMVLYLGLLALTYQGFQILPSGFVPLQDKQYLVAFAQLPQGATLDRTEEVMREMSDIALKEPGVESALAFPGLSINGLVNSSSSGIVFVTLDDFATRKSDELSGLALAGTLQQKYAGIDEAFVAIFPAPPVQGLGTVGGFKLQVEDRADQGYRALDDVMQQVLAKAWAAPELTGVFTSYNINVPQLQATLDRTKVQQLGIPVDEVFQTMQVYLGSMYVNDFNAFGRTYQVIAQADKPFRSSPEDILRLQTRNSDGEMVPLGSVVSVDETFGPDTSMRYNGFRAADLNGSPAPGYSSGQAEAAMIKILDETLPPGMSYEWTELTYQQILAGDTAMYVFPICILLVFLVLAAQYESLTMPLAVIMIVPMSILSAVFGVYLFGGDNNIFTQISLFVLAGLASKNAILIVEFARELEHQGRTTLQAAIEASRLRLRPILMTSLAFIMGVVPLVLSSGAGAEMRHAIGIAVFSGMLGVTIFGLILTPVFYVLVRMIGRRDEVRSLNEADPHQSAE
ncbi:efflux RND transporter permease subunit [Thalassospira lucentensis]|uniref:efflux RND transporter permease subunit n=1 Tax=Thalassospira lucentensis TaxID=168935 RepID=UPI003AA9C7AC